MTARASADTVRALLRAHLEQWLPYHLADACRFHELAADHIGPPRSWKVLASLDSVIAAASADQLPAVFVTTPGLANRPAQEEGGNTVAVWRMHATIVARDDDWEGVATRVAIYAQAIREAVAQHASLGGVARSCDWVGEEYDPLAVGQSGRSLGAARVDFDLAVDTLNVMAGPLEPPADPLAVPDPDPVVDDTTADVHPALQ